MALVVKDDKIEIQRLELGPFGTNSYIVSCRVSKQGVLVDAPGNASWIMGELKGIRPQCILITHNHMDHTGALSELKSKLGIPVAAHPLDADWLPVAPDTPLGDGHRVSFGKLHLKVLHTPGHTPGSVCFLTGKYLLSGDTIFPGGPGKTGSPADLDQIIESITTKILTLPEDTQIFPGHGESTILQKEKAEFAVFSSRPRDPRLCGDVLWLSS